MNQADTDFIERRPLAATTEGNENGEVKHSHGGSGKRHEGYPDQHGGPGDRRGVVMAAKTEADHACAWCGKPGAKLVAMLPHCDGDHSRSGLPGPSERPARRRRPRPRLPFSAPDIQLAKNELTAMGCGTALDRPYAILARLLDLVKAGR